MRVNNTICYSNSIAIVIHRDNVVSLIKVCGQCMIIIVEFLGQLVNNELSISYINVLQAYSLLL